ncbi:hypothetical protein CAPTEDRAFT_202673 [Capitella teleta]|uniref:Uncharacterized protein n=1 Tax=Capitella teleta TaxID=283909 RepID=R7THR3_CAPTE|nr:hypothetical protein CAPTEDRAFT_202673 [Capitella teleta]|eukprot:ELT93328.1 hypothetical protein CAPTEDRAFT_202673 [Capitella teleta]
MASEEKRVRSDRPKDGDYCCRLQYFVELISDAVNRGLKHILFKFGCVIGRYPAVVLVACCLFAACFVPGIVLYHKIEEVSKLTIPTDSHLIAGKEFVEKYFSAALTPDSVIFKADNVLEPSVLRDACCISCQLREIKGRENWLKMDFESLFDAPKMIPMPGPHKEYHR